MGDNTCICMGILMWMSDKDDIHILEHRGVCMAFMYLYHIIFIHPYELFSYILMTHLYVFMNYFLSHLSFNLLIMFINVPIIMFTSFSNDS